MNYKYILKRILQLIPVLLLVSIFSFYLVNVAPGDPAESYRSPGMTEEQFEAIKEELGLNGPIHVQYVRWLGRILKGDLGNSIVMRQGVGKLMADRLPATIGLMLAAMVFSLLVSMILGVIAGMNHGKLADKVISGFTYVGISVPTFWFGILLIILFSLNMKLFPSGGMTTTGIGCAGRGILTTFTLLEQLEAFETYQPDFVFYDILGDVVCGGFAAPIRDGYADEVMIVTSGEKMALFAARNIYYAVENFRDRNYATVRGVILNRRNTENEEPRVRAFAEEAEIPIIGDIPRDSHVQSCENRNQTVIEGAPDSPAATAIRKVAQSLVDSYEEEKRSGGIC